VREKSWCLKIVFGTDALAGMHGHNAEDLINRVHEGGIEPMDALISAHSFAAGMWGKPKGRELTSAPRRLQTGVQT